jgi:hypothetical protein
LLPDFGEPTSGSKKNKWYKQESQNLGARKTNGINRRAKIPDFGSPVYSICFSCSQILALLFIPFVFLAPRFWLSCLYHIDRRANIWEQEKQMV